METKDALYDIAKSSAFSAYFDRALTAYIHLAANPALTGENRLIGLRKAMEIAKTPQQQNNILHQIKQANTFTAMIYAGKYLDNKDVQEAAAQAVMNIALNNPDFTGNEIRQLLEKTASVLNNPDADYQYQAIRKHLNEMPQEEGYVSLFNGKDLTGWKGLVDNLPMAEPFELSVQEKKEGYKILFDGTNMHAWTGNTVDYTTDNGTISLVPSRGSGGNLYTKDEYDNFIFRFEFQLTPAANNGLGIRTPMEGDAAYVGMELQILDNEHPVYKDLEVYQYHGSVYGIIPAKRGALKPAGEWNYQEVIANGDNIKITLNGQVIVDGNIREATRNGTADKMQHPGLFNKKGHIAFLGHGSPVKFRNIRIKELK